MKNLTVYKTVELTGTLPTSIKRTNQTVKKLSWFQLIETRGSIDMGKVHHWQATIKIAFALESLGEK